MGMESFNIMILPCNINIVRNKEYWGLSGTTEIKVDFVTAEIRKMRNIKKKKGGYVIERCIEVKLYEKDNCFQGFELRGCLSYLKGGIDICYNFYNYWEARIPMKLYIHNQEVEVHSSTELYKVISNMYFEKINIFAKQYGSIEMKVTCGDFYRKIKRKIWLHKVNSHFS